MRIFLMILGFLAALLIIAQLTMGQMIVQGHGGKLIKAHQHSGYLTVAVVLVYITLSLIAIASMKKERA